MIDPVWRVIANVSPGVFEQADWHNGARAGRTSSGRHIEPITYRGPLGQVDNAEIEVSRAVPAEVAAHCMLARAPRIPARRCPRRRPRP